MALALAYLLLPLYWDGFGISQGQALALADSPAAVQNPAVNGRIVYFADSRMNANSPLAPGNVVAQIGAQRAETWTDVLEAQAQAPIDVLIIHSTAQDRADRQWVREAYNNGMMIVLAQLLVSICSEVPQQSVSYLNAHA